MAQNSSKLLSLASHILQDVSQIDQHLTGAGEAVPSFAADATLDWDRDLPPHLLGPRARVLEACTELQALVEGPKSFLTRITSPRMNVMMSLQAIYRFKIASLLQGDETVSYSDLAKRTGMDLSQLKRLMRMATANHIFQETEKGAVSHSAVSRLIAEDEIVNQWVGLVCDELWPLGPKLIPAIQKWPSSGEPDETAFGLANNASFWDVLKTDAPRAQRFADGMRFLQSHPAFNLDHLFASLAWDAADCPDVLVDIGGSQGSISTALLRQYPELKTCYVQDAPEVLQGAVAAADVRERLHFSAHNFFVEQPLKDADVYFLRSILHDWSDKYALDIIRKLIPALKPGAKIIVNEVCLPEPNVLPRYHEQLLRGYDLAMMQNFNSKERDADEWRALFEQADDRFKLERISTPPGSILSVIEVTWCPAPSSNAPGM